MNPNSPFSGFISVFFLFVLLNVGIASSADASCTDSDGGKFFYDKGKVTGVLSNGDTYANDDYCVSGSKVMEYYCFDKINPLAISEECGEGKTCKDGACIKKETSVPKCTDTDGSNLNKKGTVSGTTLDGTQYSESDSCSADGGVNEFVCTPTGYKTAKLSCGEGKTCKDGACVAVTQTCTETDEGSILDKKGTVSGIDASGAKYSYTDSCDGTVNVKEYYCVSGAMSESLNSPYAYAIKSCETGYSCSNGACVSKQKACTIGTAYSTEVNDPESAKLPTIAGEVKIFITTGLLKPIQMDVLGMKNPLLIINARTFQGLQRRL